MKKTPKGRSIEELLSPEKPRKQRPAFVSKVPLGVQTRVNGAVGSTLSEPKKGRPAGGLALAAGLGLLGAATYAWSLESSPIHGGVVEGVSFEGKYVDFPIEDIPKETSASARILARLRELDPKTRQDEIEEREQYKFGITVEKEEEFSPFVHDVDTRDQRIGSDRLLIQPYEKVKDIATPQEYQAFLFARVQSPHDVSELADHRFLPYSAAVGSLKPVSTYLELGAADCEGASVWACEGLTALGKRNGKNYHARILTQGNLSPAGHAICTYEDEGKVWAIDQSPPYKVLSLKDPFTITTLFVPFAETTSLTQEWVGQNGHTFDASLDHGFQVDYKHLSVTSPEKTFDYKSPDFSALPPHWEQFQTTGLCFDKAEVDESKMPPPLQEICTVFAVLNKGVLSNVTYKEGEVSERVFNSLNGGLAIERYRSGNVLDRSYDGFGHLLIERFKSGDYEQIVYNPVTGEKYGVKFSGEVVNPIE